MSWLSSLKSVFSPAQEVKEEEIQNVLQSYRLPNSNDSLQDRISQVNVEGRVLQITINTFKSEADDLQKIHDDLADALEPCGIQELNMHVIQQKNHEHGGCGHDHKAGESCSSDAKVATQAPTAKPNLPPSLMHQLKQLLSIFHKLNRVIQIIPRFKNQHHCNVIYPNILVSRM